MWHIKTTTTPDQKIQRFEIADKQTKLTFGEVIELWETSKPFRTFFNRILADSEFPAFRWETPPVTQSTLDRPFEFVLLKAVGQARQIDALTFAEHFQTDTAIVTFSSLRGDAMLVVPHPRDPQNQHSQYGHLASFVRDAPPEQVDQLWQSVAAAMKKRIGKKPVWLSTAGMGVSWLHVRLDDRPKYYGHAPYREEP